MPVPKDKAVFNGKGARVSGLFELKVFDATNNQLLWVEHFKDSSLQISDGSFQSYFRDGSPETAGDYSQGAEDGLWDKRDTSGHVIDSSFYVKGTLTRYVHRGYYKSGYPDSVIILDMHTNDLAKRYYADSNVIANEAFFTGNKGLLKFYDKGVYKSSDSVFSREEIEASFPGGAEAWTRFIVRAMQSHADALEKGNIYGNCIVKFIVNKEGRVTDVTATNMQGTALADIAVSIIKNSPKWNPASQYGRKVNAYRLQPVTIEKPE